MGYLDGFGVTIRQHREFGGDRPTRQYSGGRVARRWLVLDTQQGGELGPDRDQRCVGAQPGQ